MEIFTGGLRPAVYEQLCDDDDDDVIVNDRMLDLEIRNIESLHALMRVDNEICLGCL